MASVGAGRRRWPNALGPQPASGALVPAHVILGAQWGDEGKGKLVDYLAGGYDAVARFQGGNNAGHTVIVGQDTFKLHLLPSGVVTHRPVFIGNGVVVDPRALVKELDQLKERGIEPELTISARAHVILPWHTILDGASEDARGAQTIGTTRRGIGPCYTDKAARRGVRVGELVDPDRFRARLDEVWPVKHQEMTAWDRAAETDPARIVREYGPLAERIDGHVGDVGGRLEAILAGGGRVMLEGAQGVLLDVDHGTYPYVTSSSTVAGNASAGAGIPAHRVEAVLGVAKAYTTRVGEGPFPTELAADEGIGKRLVDVGHEVGTTTGRARRVGWLDLVALRYACRVGGITHLAVTKLDVLDGIDPVRVAVAYEVDGEEVRAFPEDPAALTAAKPVYHEFDGWDAARDEVGNLVPDVEAYLAYLSTDLGVPVAFASVGPERSQTVAVEPGPFTAGRKAEEGTS